MLILSHIGSMVYFWRCATSAAGGVKTLIKQHRRPKTRTFPDSLSASTSSSGLRM
ncbi:unnamed protein product [Penicillium nalgiovense]|nr:unnamed protein product [Penicillium nalgiovense]